MTSYLPTLGLFTALFELAGAAWAFTSPGRKRILRPVGGLLLLLAGYQLAEIFVCAAPSQVWRARVALADVIWLPPLGVWLVLQLSQKRSPWMVSATRFGFLVAGALAMWVLLDPSAVSGTVCHLVTATYRNPSSMYLAYGAYYQFGLAAILFGASVALANTKDETLRGHLADFQMGTMGFVLPALLTLALVPAVSGSMPSLMCHYALVLGAFLVRVVHRERRWYQSTYEGTSSADGFGEAIA